MFLPHNQFRVQNSWRNTAPIIQISVNDVASPWQNGYCESFFGRFEAKFGNPNRFESVGALIEAVYHQIHYYNHEPIHTTLKMPSTAYATQIFSDTGLQELRGLTSYPQYATEQENLFAITTIDRLLASSQ